MLALHFLHGALANDEDIDGRTTADYVCAAAVPHLFVDVNTLAAQPRSAIQFNQRIDFAVWSTADLLSVGKTVALSANVTCWH